MKLTFYGAVGQVTGSNHLIEIDGYKILVDCGLFQGSSSEKRMNFEELPYDPGQIDMLILTHAHIDHSGRIPLLFKKGFKGEVICTRATKGLCEIMLPDSAHIQEYETEYKNRKRKRAGKKPLEPLYNKQDAQKALENFRAVDYNNVIKINDLVHVRFRDAGHILGSSIVEFWGREADKTIKVVFSGDIGKYDTPIINDPSEIEEADYLVMESTYGNKRHIYKENADRRMFEVIEETLKKNGTVIIPSFAVGRTQEMIYGLNRQIDLRERYKLIKNVPVYVDSPLAISATEVFKKNTEYFDDEAKKYILGGDNPLDFENLVFTRTAEESKMINKTEGPKIIISASGMCDAGRIKHHLKHNIWKEDTTVLFVGYQAPGTLGRRILDGADEVRIFGDTIKVRARIEMIDGFSGHGDMDDLDKFVNNFKKKPKNIFLVHGERDQITAFSARLAESYGLTSTIPEMGETYELEYSGFEQKTPEANRKMTKMSFRRLELINMIKRVKDQIADLSTLISYGDINKMEEKDIEDTIASYLRMEKEITEILHRIDNSDD